MIKRILASASICFFCYLGIVYACGPEYEPRYSGAPYIDIDHKPEMNFGYVLSDYLVKPDHRRREYVAESRHYNNYINKLETMISNSGRAIKVNLQAKDLSETVCAGNTLDSSQIYEKIKKFEWPNERGKTHYLNTIQMVISETKRICGPIKNFGNQEYKVNSAVERLEGYKGIEVNSEYVWMVLARFFTYSFETEKALKYIDKLSSTSNEVVQEQIKGLRKIVAASENSVIPNNIELSYDYFKMYRGYCGNKVIETIYLYIGNLLKSSASDNRVMDLMKAREILAAHQCRRQQENSLDEFEALVSKKSENKIESDYTKYLVAASLFYKKDYENALKEFNALINSSDLWIAETALYLKGRITLISSQVKWNGYSDPVETVNKELVAAARMIFETYLKKYPNGLYSKSAQGMSRRMHYFSGNKAALGKEIRILLNMYAGKLVGELKVKKTDNTDTGLLSKIKKQLNIPSSKPDAVVENSRSNENSNQFRYYFNEWKKYTDRGVSYSNDHALIIAYDVIYHQGDAELRLEKLRKHKDKFIDMADLYNLLEYMLLYSSDKHDEIFEDKKDVSFDNQANISAAVIKAKSAITLGRHERGRNILTSLRGSNEERKSWDALQLEIAASYIDQNNYKEMSKKESHVDLTFIFEDAFYEVCDIDVLVSIANDKNSHGNAREAARRMAFNRYIYSANFEELNKLYASIHDHGEYSLIETASRSLSRNKDDAKGLLNIGYFMLTKISPHGSVNEKLKATEDAIKNCKNKSSDRKVYGPKEYFGRVVNLHDNNTKSVDEAKALHYLVMCGKRGQRGAACISGYNSQDVKLLSNKQAFNRLHKKYPRSKWADKTPVHY